MDFDISNYMKTGTTGTKKVENSIMRENAQTIDMEAFLKLFVAQMQHQDPLSPMDNSEMMAQMAQMATVEAINTITDVSKTTYAASLVGKEVTVADISDNGKLTEVLGTVTGAGLYAGEQIIFVDGKSYSLKHIMCIGRLPEADKVPEGGTTTED
jgi:flagellar basal-body rod modification protein FlgD